MSIERAYKCSKCDYSTAYPTNLDTHMSVVHPHKPPKKKVPFCDKCLLPEFMCLCLNKDEDHKVNNEIRIVDPETGGAKGSKLARYDLIPVMPLQKLAEQYGRGATKYDDRNWERGYKWSLSYAAAQRHLNAFWSGEDFDCDWPEGVDPPHHLDAAIFHLMALREFSGKGLGTDDRAT